MSEDETTPTGPRGLVELAHRMLDLAREGEARTLLAYVDGGVPVDLTDARGNTLLMLAAYHGHAAVVAGLAGARRRRRPGQRPRAVAAGRGGVQGRGRGGGHAARRSAPTRMPGTPSARATAEMFGRTL